MRRLSHLCERHDDAIVRVPCSRGDRTRTMKVVGQLFIGGFREVGTEISPEYVGNAVEPLTPRELEVLGLMKWDAPTVRSLGTS